MIQISIPNISAVNLLLLGSLCLLVATYAEVRKKRHSNVVKPLCDGESPALKDALNSQL